MQPTLKITAITIVATALAGLAGCDAADARSAADAPRADEAEAPALNAGAGAQPMAPAPQQGASIDLGFTRGDPEAPIKVVEFSDFGCPYCARFARATLPVLTEEYIEPGTIRWRFVPVVFGFPGGELMGSAAICAAEQGGQEAFWQAHDLLYTRQQPLRAEGARPQLLDWMAEAGLDRGALATCIDAPATAATLRRHTDAARRWYVRGTPTFVVNGVPMAGAAPTAFFRQIFETVLDPSGL
jgi:protein-disulfide isomerase